MCGYYQTMSLPVILVILIFIGASTQRSVSKNTGISLKLRDTATKGIRKEELAHDSTKQTKQDAAVYATFTSSHGRIRRSIRQEKCREEIGRRCINILGGTRRLCQTYKRMKC